MRKLLSFLLCLVIVLTLALPVCAAETEGEGSQEQPSAPVQCSHNWQTVSSVAPTCTQAGTTNFQCGDCGATRTDTLSATGHSLGEITQKDESCHKRTCSACGYEDTSAHTLTENVITAATCVTAGQSSFSCPCGYSFTQDLPATGLHIFTEWSATVETHSRNCTTCTHSEGGNHSFTERVEQPATCKEDGIIADYCPTCDYIVYEVLPKLTTHTYDNACDTECNVCGLIREIEHQYQQWRTKGVTGHWYACSVCGDKGSFEKHYPGPAATEEKDQICLTCGYVMTPRLNHQHDYAKEWTSNEEGHWYACSGCEEQKEFRSHEYEDACDADCNICGYKTGNAHTFDGVWHSDEEGHWFVCAVCGSVAESTAHTPPEEINPAEDQFCTDCGYKIAEATAHIHVFSENWEKSDSAHWRVCECGEKADNTTHIWEQTQNDGTVIVHSCSVCGAEYSEEISVAEEQSFPWWIVLLVLVLLLVAAIVALIFALKPRKKGRFTA